MQTDLFIDIVKDSDSAHGADRESVKSKFNGQPPRPLKTRLSNGTTGVAGNKEVPRYKQDKILVNLNGNNLWDSCWFRKKYPDRFDSHYFTEWDIKNERQLNYEKMYGTGKK